MEYYNPENPLKWTSKSVRNLAYAMKDKGYSVSKTTVGVMLHDLGKVLTFNEVLSHEILIPNVIGDLGLNHKQQISLVSDVQQVLLNKQTKGIISHTICPKCESELSKNGYEETQFHGVLSDHKLQMSKLKCKSEHCNWTYNPSINSHFGDTLSPDIMKLQAEFGSDMSFRKAQNSLNAMAGSKRPINNHMRVRRSAISCGESIESYRKSQVLEIDKNKISESDKQTTEHEKEDACTKTMISVVDGIYVSNADDPGHNFEIMTAKLYNPESIVKVSNNRYKITQKSCITSTVKDAQITMKEKIVEIAKLDGVDKNTKVIALADGAKNCWNVLKALAPLCGVIYYILDWWHINKEFKALKRQLPVGLSGYITTARNAVWYGEVEAGLRCLENLKLLLSSPAHLIKLQKLMTYLSNNKEYIVSYYDRMIDELPYTSQAAESTVEHLVAERCKKKQKMAWSRKSLHPLLEVRSAIASDTFDDYWKNAKSLGAKKSA